MIKQFYPDRESKSLEFKSQLPNFHALVKTCVAFANGVGGKIVIGVDDNSCEIIGINDKTRDRVYDEFPNSLYDATSPNLFAEIYEKRFGEKSVMIIEISHGTKKPVLIKSEGMPNGVYLRAGSNTRRASQEYIEELMRENKRTNFDEEVIHADINILSKKLLNAVLKKTDAARLKSEKIINQASAHAEKNYPTVSGVLLFCETPDEYIPEAVIHCTRFAGNNGRDIIQTEEIKGCLEDQIERSFQLIKSWLMRDYKLLGAKLKAKMIIPETALRETIINAAIHRKYWIPGAIKIALYDNRLEIFNPGNFPGLFDISQLGDGATYLRNPNLARLARRLGLVEKLGTGIALIFESCEKARIQKPEFIEGADSVKVIFNFLPANEEHVPQEEKLMALFYTQKEVKLSDVENCLSVSRNTATRKLNKLIESGKIRREGSGPSVRYFLYER